MSFLWVISSLNETLDVMIISLEVSRWSSVNQPYFLQRGRIWAAFPITWNVSGPCSPGCQQQYTAPDMPDAIHWMPGTNVSGKAFAATGPHWNKHVQELRYSSHWRSLLKAPWHIRMRYKTSLHSPDPLSGMRSPFWNKRDIQPIPRPWMLKVVDSHQ